VEGAIRVDGISSSLNEEAPISIYVFGSGSPSASGTTNAANGDVINGNGRRFTVFNTNITWHVRLGNDIPEGTILTFTRIDNLSAIGINIRGLSDGTNYFYLLGSGTAVSTISLSRISDGDNTPFRSSTTIVKRGSFWYEIANAENTV
jgi:hypothetical protein